MKIVELPETLDEALSADTLTLVYQVITTVGKNTEIIPAMDEVIELPEEKQSSALKNILDELDAVPQAVEDDDQRIL